MIPVATPAMVIENVELGAHPVSTTTVVLPDGMMTVDVQGPVDVPPGAGGPARVAGEVSPGAVVTVVVPG